MLKATVLVALTLLWLPAQAADSNAGYQSRRPTTDGTGKLYMGREIAPVMGWQAADWLERPEREEEERVSELIAELKLQPGMVVADIGAGSGYTTRRIAPVLGPRGKVLAVDIQPQMVELIRKLPRIAGAAPIEAVLSSATDTRLPPASVDLAFMVDVYHELDHPHEMLESLVRALKPGGQVVFVEYRAEDAAVPIKTLHKMSERQIRLEAAQHSLTWDRTSQRLPWQHMVFFRKSSAAAP